MGGMCFIKSVAVCLRSRTEEYGVGALSFQLCLIFDYWHTEGAVG